MAPATSPSQVTLGGKPVHTVGSLPKKGDKAPGFELVNAALQTVSLGSYAGQRKVLNVFPSIDTPTCAKSVRTFNGHAASMRNTVVLNISLDLPFAQKRFCGAEGIEKAESLSGFRSTFGRDYGLLLADGPLVGLYARAVIVVDENDRVLHSELVPEIANEPNYDAALAALKG